MVVQAFGGMFCISGLLGIYGSCATLAGYCMSRHFGIAGVNVFKLKVCVLHHPQKYIDWTFLENDTAATKSTELPRIGAVWRVLPAAAAWLAHMCCSLLQTTKECLRLWCILHTNLHFKQDCCNSMDCVCH